MGRVADSQMSAPMTVSCGAAAEGVPAGPLRQVRGLVPFALLAALLAGGIASCLPPRIPLGKPQAEPSVNLLAFVGRRIEVQPRSDPSSMDESFEARYEVLEVVFGEFSGREISFRVWDHYGPPPFTEYEGVLLYLSRDQDGWFHQKYLYNPVFRNDLGQWAGCGGHLELVAKFHKLEVPSAVPMRFRPDAEFNLSSVAPKDLDEVFPPRHYERRGNKAVCRTGASLGDLFDLRRRGVLTARGVFGKAVPR